MALTIFRTTYSGVLKDNMDYSTALADADGKLVARGLTVPGHLASGPTPRAPFACPVCHHTDVGGRVAGSNASDSTEIYAEGLRIAPMKLYEAGKLNQTIMTFIEKNVRLPVQVFGDLRAQLAACHIAEKQFAEIVPRYGRRQKTVSLQAE